MAAQKRTQIRHWIVAGYAVPILLSVFSSVLVWNSVRVLRQEAREVEEFVDNASAINVLALDTQLMSRSTRGYLIEPSDVSLETYNDAKEEFLDSASQLSEAIDNEMQQDLLQQIVQSVNALIATNDRLIATAQSDRAAAIAQWRTRDVRTQIETIDELFEAFRDNERQLVLASQSDQRDALVSLINATIALTLITVIVSVSVGGWILRSITRQMNQSAGAVASSSAEIAATVEQQERAATQQAASVNETTTTMDELGASSRQVMEQAESATSNARQALSQADNGTLAVAETLETMNALKDKVGAIAQQILRLSEQTNQIGNISSLVSNLANQTNMLALNAAVEAVRAGEHGKGFSVVASEIRKLADQSKKSAEKINALVADIQNAINSTVMVTDEGTKTVESGVRVTENTSEAFTGVREGINNVVLNNQQIALTLKQQVNAVQQVVEAMNALNTAAQETASGIAQVKVGTQRLNDAAVTMKEMV